MGQVTLNITDNLMIRGKEVNLNSNFNEIKKLSRKDETFKHILSKKFGIILLNHFGCKKIIIEAELLSSQDNLRPRVDVLGIKDKEIYIVECGKILKQFNKKNYRFLYLKQRFPEITKMFSFELKEIKYGRS